MLEAMESVGKLRNEDLQLFLNQLSEWDRFYLHQAAGVIRTEHLGFKSEMSRIKSIHDNRYLEANKAHLETMAARNPTLMGRGSNGSKASNGEAHGEKMVSVLGD